jgi:hypothetical protein
MKFQHTARARKAFERKYWESQGHYSMKNLLAAAAAAATTHQNILCSTTWCN